MKKYIYNSAASGLNMATCQLDVRDVKGGKDRMDKILSIVIVFFVLQFLSSCNATKTENQDLNIFYVASFYYFRPENLPNYKFNPNLNEHYDVSLIDSKCKKLVFYFKSTWLKENHRVDRLKQVRCVMNKPVEKQIDTVYRRLAERMGVEQVHTFEIIVDWRFWQPANVFHEPRPNEFRTIVGYPSASFNSSRGSEEAEGGISVNMGEHCFELLLLRDYLMTKPVCGRIFDQSVQFMIEQAEMISRARP